MRYFDSHAHYYDARFSELNGGVDELIGTLLAESVSGIVNVGTSPATSRLAIAQAARFENMYTAIGIHPSDCQELSEPLSVAIADIEALATSPASKCVAIGEIGLDYHYPDTDRELQLRYFEEQLLLAKRLGLPVSIHDRDAHGDVMDVLRRHRGVRGVMHSFSGSAEMARELVEMGFMISFSGTLTFKNARRPKEALAAVPHEHILIETDCPYLAPHPERGTLNHSGKLRLTNAALAEAIGISEEEAARLTEENARRLFGI